MSDTNSNKGLNAVIIVLGIFAVGGTVYLIIQNSAANVGVNTSNNPLTTPSASQSAAASQAAITKAATTTSTSTSGVSGLSSLATSLVNLGKNVASKLTGAATSSNVPKTTVDSSGDYIEVADPTTLYDKNGNVIGNRDGNTGQFMSANDPNWAIANSDGTPITYADSNPGGVVDTSTSAPGTDLLASITPTSSVNSNSGGFVDTSTTAPGTDLLNGLLADQSVSFNGNQINSNNFFKK